MIAHWPKGIAAPGRINRNPVHLIDIMPTIAALSGAKSRRSSGNFHRAGVQNNPLAGDEDMYWEFGSGQAIRRGDMKLVTRKQKPWELYNLATDRSETRTLAKQMPKLVQELEVVEHVVDGLHRFRILGPQKRRVRKKIRQFSNARFCHAR